MNEKLKTGKCQKKITLLERPANFCNFNQKYYKYFVFFYLDKSTLAYCHKKMFDISRFLILKSFYNGHNFPNRGSRFDELNTK